jgi:hypothetical protein
MVRNKKLETENELLLRGKLLKKEKGINAKELTHEEKIVSAINLLLCHCTQENPFDTAVGLQMAIERLGVEEYCHLWYDMGCHKMRLWYTGNLEGA